MAQNKLDTISRNFGQQAISVTISAISGHAVHTDTMSKKLQKRVSLNVFYLTLALHSLDKQNFQKQNPTTPTEKSPLLPPLFNCLFPFTLQLLSSIPCELCFKAS